MKILLKNLKFTWKYVKKEKYKYYGYIVANIVSIIISIGVPIVAASMIVSLTQNNYEQLIWTGLLLFGLEELRNVVLYLNNYFSTVIYRETFIQLQTDLGKEILNIETKAIDKNGSGLFIQRLSSDTSKLSDIFNIINSYLSTILANIGVFVAIFIINKYIAIYILINVIVSYLIDKKRVKLYSERDKKFREKSEKTYGFVGELIRGIRDIKMLNAEKNFISELYEKILDLNYRRYEMTKINRNYNFFRGTINDMFNFGLIVIFVILLANSQITIAGALIIYNYSGRVTNIVLNVGYFMEQIKDFNLSTSRIMSIMNNDEFPKDKFGSDHINKVKGNFEFRNVSFGYDESKIILDNLSFKVNANETVAFVGKSGAGKTTIFNLLCKMYNINSGEILIDGMNINNLDKVTIRGNITIISQNPYIFNLSIKDNLRLVKDGLTEKEMIKACKLACLHDYIMTLPEKYDTIIGEGGVTLSGGQRQRLAIARAFVQKTEIILFDEATSALDNETQTNIQKAIENLKKSYTILIIAHRLSTVVNSDRILLLNDGKIIAEGTHKQLLKNHEEYKKLYKSELKDKNSKDSIK